MTDSSRPPLEVVVVAYGPPAPLVGCLEALAGAFAPIVVDNSSLAATKTLVEAHGGRYIDAGSNLGFGAGVNLALRNLSHPHADVLLLNPDATINPDDVLRLQDRLHADPSLACIAPAQIDPASGESVRVYWPLPTPAGSWLEAAGLGSLRAGHGFVIGSILLLRAQAILDVGLFDEQFFLYAEETDWEMRARDKGWTVAMFPGVVATHIGAGTGGSRAQREAYFYASHERLIRKHYGPTGWHVYRAANVVGAALRGVLLPGERGRKSRFRLGLYLKGPAKAEAGYRSTAE
jgi:GT2 family glycosyltransferase